MAKKAFLFFALMCALRSAAQSPVSASFGAGYKPSFGTVGLFVMGVDLSDRITYQLGPALNIAYSGMGATTGFKWAFVKARNYSVSLNADYQFLFSRNVSRLFDSDKRFSTYRTPAMHHLFASASFNVLMSRYAKNLGQDKFSITAGYGFGLSDYQPLLVAGEENREARKGISQAISSGLAICVSYTAYLFQ